jgi:hypothetical protein
MTKAAKTYAIIGGSLVGLYLILRAFKSDDEKAIDNIDKTPTGDNSTQALFGGQPFTDAMARSVAQTLHDYMRYCGTDETGILTVLSQGYNGKALNLQGVRIAARGNRCGLPRRHRTFCGFKKRPWRVLAGRNVW